MDEEEEEVVVAATLDSMESQWSQDGDAGRSRSSSSGSNSGGRGSSRNGVALGDEEVSSEECLMSVPNDWRLAREPFESARRETSNLSKPLQRFYRAQNDLVDTFLAMERHPPPQLEPAEALELAQRKTIVVKVGIYASFFTNVLLFVLKVIAAIQSSSVAIIASAVDSFLDLLSGSIIFLTNYYVRRSSIYLYPAGKQRIEPLGIIVFAAIMFTATLQLLTSAVETLFGLHDHKINLAPFTIVVAVITVVAKLALFLYCKRVKGNASLEALTEDHRNDVMSNTVGMLGAVAGAYWWVGVDPIVGILLGLYIMVNWFNTGKDHVARLSGRTASPEFLKQLTFVVWNHDERIDAIDTVRAYHLASGFLVEIDIVLAEDMPLKEAHDIGESLQAKVERLEHVERCHVHLDYETQHDPTKEHIYLDR